MKISDIKKMKKLNGPHSYDPEGFFNPQPRSVEIYEQGDDKYMYDENSGEFQKTKDGQSWPNKWEKLEPV